MCRLIEERDKKKKRTRERERDLEYQYRLNLLSIGGYRCGSVYSNIPWAGTYGRMYYVNMPIPNEPLWSNPTPLRQSMGDTMAFDRAPKTSKFRRSRRRESYVPSPGLPAASLPSMPRQSEPDHRSLARARSRNILQAHYQRMFW